MSVPAGWYPDSQPGVMRYWDGSAWTDHTHQTAKPALVGSPRSRKKPDSNGRAWLKVLGLVAVGTVLVALLANGCEAINRNQKPAHYTYVVYTADSRSKTGSVTYSTPDGIRQENDQTLPFRYSHVVSEIGQHY
jgi:hypothetical protein